MTTKKSNKSRAKQAAKTVKEAAERTGIAALSAADVARARSEGVTEAIKEDAKSAYEFATDGQLPGDPPAARQFTYSDAHSNFVDKLLALGPDELEDRIAEDADHPLSEDQVANLLALERNGPNRTAQVQILCKRLGLKTPYELPGAGGPAYTNDVTNVTKIER